MSKRESFSKRVERRTGGNLDSTAELVEERLGANGEGLSIGVAATNTSKTAPKGEEEARRR